MQLNYLKGLINLLLLGMLSQLVQAGEISIPYKDLEINARFELANGKLISDEVILITHGGLAHRDMEIINNLQEQLNSRGHNTLAINLSLGISQRHGMYDCQQTHRHQNSDAPEEIDAWLGWLAERGVRRVTLLGHSRGAAQIALYATQRYKPNDKNHRQTKNRTKKPELIGVILMAPPTRENGGDGYQARYQQPLLPVLQRAQQMIAEGRGENVLPHANMMFCRDVNVSANSFVSYYGSDPLLDTPGLIPHLMVPTLVIVAGEDEVVVGLEKRVEPLVNAKHINLKLIDGADHFFRDLYADDAIDVIDEFLAEYVTEKNISK